MDNIAKIIKLFQAQMNIIRDLLEEKIRAEGARIAAEISMHKRDRHLEYWDPTYYLESEETRREKLSDLHKKIEENQKKIAELVKVNETPVINPLIPREYPEGESL